MTSDFDEAPGAGTPSDGAGSASDEPRSSKDLPYVVVFDGGAMGNPGRGYGSYLLMSPTGKNILRRLDFSDRAGRMTNNQAEYETLIHALKDLKAQLGKRVAVEHVKIEGDSELVLNQTSGAWKVKKERLRPLQAEAAELAREFASVQFAWHPRIRSLQLLGH